MQKLSVFTLMAASLGMSASAMAVLPTVTLDPVDSTQVNSGSVNNSQFAPVAAVAAANPVAVTVAPTARVATPVYAPVATMPATAVAPVAAPVANQIQTRILASVVGKDPQGQEVLSPVTAQTRLASGNIVEYRGYLTNNSPDRIRNMKVTLDIPANMELLSTTDVLPERAYGSMDGVNFQYMPLKTNMNGVLQNLPTSYYKAVQWDIAGLGLNEVAMVKYRLKVK